MMVHENEIKLKETGKAITDFASVLRRSCFSILCTLENRTVETGLHKTLTCKCFAHLKSFES